MSNYICKYGLYHDKAVKGDMEPSSNNGFKYSADAKALGFEVSDLTAVFDQCVMYSIGFIATRLPGKQTPPISRDELIGMDSLRLPIYKELKKRNFYYSEYTNKDYSLFQSVRAVWSLRGKHRNYVWENKIYAAYPIVFRLPIHDRYYMKKNNGDSGGLVAVIMFQLYCLTTIFGSNVSAKNILWLQLHNLKSKYWIKLIEREKNFMQYFGEEHIFNN